MDDVTLKLFEQAVEAKLEEYKQSQTEIEKQRLTVFDRFVMAAITGLTAGNYDPEILELKDHVFVAREYATEAMKQRDKADDPPDLERKES